MDGLSADIIFIQAIERNSGIMRQIGERLYPTAIACPDEELDNTPVPYVIVANNGMENDVECKDSSYESSYDNVKISIEVTADSREALADLTSDIRQAVKDYVTSLAGAKGFPLTDYKFSAAAVQYDGQKPCYWQVLNYQCEVYNQEES